MMRKLLLSAAIAAALGGIAEAQARTETLVWDVPTLRDDGSALPASAIAKFEAFDIIGVLPPSPTWPATPVCSVTGAPTGTTATCTTGQLQSGVTHNFAVFTTDTAGNKSAVSNVLVVSVPLGAPAAITSLRGTLN